MAQQGQQTEQDVLEKGKASMANSNEDCTATETPKVLSPVAEEEVEDIWEREAKKWRASQDTDNGTWRTWPDDDSMLTLCSFVVSSIEHGIPDIKYNASDISDEQGAEDDYDAEEQADKDIEAQVTPEVADKDDAVPNVVAEKVDADKVDTEDNVADDDADAKDPSSSSSKPNP